MVARTAHPLALTNHPEPGTDQHWRQQLEDELSYLYRRHRCEILQPHPQSSRIIAELVIRQGAVARQIAEHDARVGPDRG